MMGRFVNAVLLSQLFLSFCGCAQLPEYARPHLMEVAPGPDGSGEAITYRQLAAEDFQAPGLPADISPHEKKIGARICCSIRVAEGSKIAISRGYLDQRTYYFGSMRQIAFEAVVDPKCSWLNPDLSGEKLDYVLEHEQVHFALMEVAAGELTREVKKEAKKFISIQPTLEDARGAIMQKIGEMVGAANRAALKEHTSFDRDTSLFFNPRGQRLWMDRVNERLSETGSN